MDPTLQELFSEFKDLETIDEKITFLEFWKTQKLPYYEKWDGTIEAWRKKNIK